MAAPAVTVTEPPKTEKKSCCHHRQLYKATELPIYGAKHHQKEYELVKETPGALQGYVSFGRVAVEKYTGSLAGAKDQVVNYYETGVAHTKSTYAMLTDDSSTVPRAAAITLGGLTGMLIAFRRGKFKKLLYGSTGAGIVASICYPKEAKELSQQMGHKIKTDGFPIVKEQTGYDMNELFNWELPKLPEMPNVSSILSKIGLESKTKVQGDVGQSNPADKDMYTTRTK